MQSTCAVLYCRLCPVRLCSGCPQFLTNGSILGKKVIENKMCFDFLYKSVRKISHSKKNSARYDRKCKQIVMQNICYSRQTLLELEFSRHILNKSARTEFNENPSSGSRVVPCGQTDGQTWRRKQRLFAALRMRLKITKNNRKNRRAADVKTGIYETGMCHSWTAVSGKQRGT
jgi:hypothetical protein